MHAPVGQRRRFHKCPFGGLLSGVDWAVSAQCFAKNRIVGMSDIPHAPGPPPALVPAALAIALREQARDALCLKNPAAKVSATQAIARARGEDNDARRRELIKRLVAEGFGLDALGPQDMLGAHTHKVIWRGPAREVDLVFGNVRDAGWLTDEHFRARPSTWRFVVDHPSPSGTPPM